MLQTMTAKLKILPNTDESRMLLETMTAYSEACTFVAKKIAENLFLSTYAQSTRRYISSAVQPSGFLPRWLPAPFVQLLRLINPSGPPRQNILPDLVSKSEILLSFRSFGNLRSVWSGTGIILSSGINSVPKDYSVLTPCTEESVSRSRLPNLYLHGHLLRMPPSALQS